jgi:uncharacterized membrane protein
MKSIISLAGIILIILGIVSLGYQGFTYTKQEKVAQFGDLQVTANTQKTVYLPPLFGGLSLVAGVVLVFLSRRNGN